MLIEGFDVCKHVSCQHEDILDNDDASVCTGILVYLHFIVQ